MKLRLALALVALAGTAAIAKGDRDTSEVDRALAGRTPGAPVDCIDMSGSNGPDIIDDHTILYRESGRRIWRNTLADACPFLQPDRILVVHVFGSQLCRNDRFETITRGLSIPSGSCRLGRFTPYEKPKKP